MTEDSRTKSSPAPLEEQFGTLDLTLHDETIDVATTRGEVWTGREYKTVVDLRLRLAGGSLSVTLFEEDIRALVDELEGSLKVDSGESQT